MSTTYKPLPMPTQRGGEPLEQFVKRLTQHFTTELANVYKALEGAQPRIRLDYQYAAPGRALPGEVVLGGSSWNAGLQYRSEDGTEWVYVGSTMPRSRLTATTDASLTSTGHAFQIGDTAGPNLIMDSNEIMARDNGAAAAIAINFEGGDVRLGDASSMIRFGTRTANADAAITGYITIEDAGGTTRKLALIN